MKKLLLILLCLPMIGFGQVYIPDANFKAYLVGNTAINTNGDTEIQLTEATVFSGSIICTNMGISDLTGIEAFIALDTLGCVLNQLTNLDLSQNTALTCLYCSNNQLTTLDVSNNTALTDLGCNSNQLTSLDVYSNTALDILECRSNQLTTLVVNNNLRLLYCDNNLLTNLDVSQCLYLEQLRSGFNKLTSLDLSPNISLGDELYLSNNELTSLNIKNGLNHMIVDNQFTTVNNPNLYCIEVDDDSYSNATWQNIDSQHYFSTNCSGTDIQEHTTNKELLKVTGLLGRETKQTNQPLFYIYDNGTVEKRIIIE
jgi:hypothetical protein